MGKTHEGDGGNHQDTTLSLASAVATLGNQPNIILAEGDFNRLLSTVGNTGLCSDAQGVYSVTVGGVRVWKKGHPSTPASSSTVKDASTTGQLLQGFRIV